MKKQFIVIRIKKLGYQFTIIMLMLFFLSNITNAQTNGVGDNSTKIKSYFSIMHPIATLTKDRSHFNFDDSYRVGFPVGINFIQSNKIAYSIEFAPTVSVNDSLSKVTGLLLHPGVIFRDIAGFNLLTRLAFNTNGRYGFTAVINRPIIKKEKVTYFLAMPIPFRFGNDSPFSITFGFQLGIIF